MAVLQAGVAKVTLASAAITDSNGIMSRKPQNPGLTSIVAVGLSGEIGVQNDLPWRLKSDLRFFKRTTLANVVILGRKTYDSIGGCLKGRENIVLSHRASLFVDHEGCHQAHSVEETLYIREKYPRSEAFVIGGAQTYKEFAPFVDRYLITVVQSDFPQADVFFDERIIPNRDTWSQCEIEVERLLDMDADQFPFTTLELRHPDPAAIEQARLQAVSEFVGRNHFLKRKALRRQFKLNGNLDQALRLA